MSCYWRMMNIKWMDRITNEEVLEWIGERRIAWKCLRKRRGQMMGYTLRHGGLLRDIFGGEVGKERGRSRLEDFEQIIRNMGYETFRKVKELAWDRAEWRRVVVSKDCVVSMMIFKTSWREPQKVWLNTQIHHWI